MRKQWRTVVVVALLLALLAGCAGNQTTVPTGPIPGLAENKITYKGETYQLRENLTSILVMGLDKYDRPEGLQGFTNKLQADFLMLLVIDEDAKTCEILHLNRDTMTEIRSLGIGGGVAGRFVGQLALAHTYGSGGSDSCLNAVRAVSDLLGGVDIDHYMTLTMDAVGAVNDMVGGVTLTVMDDMTQVDPELEKGKEVTLMGDQALTYVRSRMGLDDSSNLRRMERQRQYLKALYEKVMEKNRENGKFLENTVLELAESFVTDCSTNQLEKLAELMDTCTVAPVRTLAGKAQVGEEYMEFYADQEKLMETVIELFCQKLEP